MSDHLNLSFWLPSHNTLALPSTFEQVLRVFPFSRLAPAATLRVHAVSFAEPPLFEQHYDDPLDLAAICQDASDFLHSDAAFQLETNWELWRFDEDWSLKPSRIWLEAYGPDFESSVGEHVRIDAGPETLYLPPASDPTAKLRPVESNLRSLVQLAKDVELVLAVDRRVLWSESGENFAGRLEELF